MHETIFVRWGHREAHIDVKLAGLVRALWKAGIETVYSCEDRDGRAWLQMRRSELAKWNPGDLVTSEYDGPSARDDPEVSVYFALSDVPKLIDNL